MKKFLLIAENYVLSLLKRRLNKDFLFHNANHTQQVVNSVKELITCEKIAEVDANILLFAAWFHEVGYVNRNENHLEASINIATTFFEEYNIDNSIIDDVARLIRVTKINVEATDFLEKTMKDAVSSYFSESSFFDKNALQKQETNLLFNKNYSELEWIQKSINIFVKEHRFYTSHAQENWQKGKDKNLAKLVSHEKELIKNKEVDNNLESTFIIYNSTIIKTTILLSANSLIILLSLIGYYFFNDSTESQKTLIPITILVISNVILSLLIVMPLSFKKELNQKISSKEKMLRYSYIVFVLGLLTSGVFFIFV